MKTIYTFTLEGENYPSSKFDNDLRLFAHILYETIYNYDGENSTPLNINKNIEYNHINENSEYWDYGSQYKLDSDLYDDGFIDYEPFILGNDSVGLTISDESFGLKTIEAMIQEVLELLKFNYKVKINFVRYDARNNEDERNRSNAMRTIFNVLGHKYNRRSSLLTMIMRSSTNKRRVRSKGRSLSAYGR